MSKPIKRDFGSREIPKWVTAPGGENFKDIKYVVGDGIAKITTYTAFDGVPEGEYTLTVIKRSPRTLDDGKAGPNLLPAGLSKVDTSTLKAVIKAGDNNINIPLD